MPTHMLIFLPIMALLPDGALRALSAAGYAVHRNPLAGPGDAEALRARLDAILARNDRPQAVILPALPMAALGPVADLAPGHALLQLDARDALSPLVAQLRLLAWRAAFGAAPLAPDFRPEIPIAKLRRGLVDLYIGRAILSRVLPAQIPTRDIDAPEGLALGDQYLSPTGWPTLENMIVNWREIHALARKDRISTKNDPEPLSAPACHGDQLRFLAITSGRNVADYLPILAAEMREQEAALDYIDNGSDDDSAAIARDLIGRGIRAVHDLPYEGSFSLSAQLEAKARIWAASAPRWGLHLDADEIARHRDPAKSLHDIASEAEAGGHNAVNFDEFVFLPRPDQDAAGGDYRREIRRYYPYAPRPFRLMRMWRQGQGLSNLDFGGHLLSGRLSLLPESHDLRHYIALSPEAARRKYGARVFDPREIARNWHGNRLGLDPEALSMPPAGDPRLLDAAPGEALRRTPAQRRHWWDWA